MATLPDQLALTSISDNAAINAAPLRNDFSLVQTAVNALIAGLSGGAAGQVLQAVDSTHVQWGPKTTVSTLAGGPPGSPADGDIWYATAVDANGGRWVFQYDASWVTDANKWKFIGGPSVGVTGATAVPGTSTWTSLVSFNPGRAGLYAFDGGWLATGNAGGTGTYQVGVGVAGVLSAALGGVVAAASNNLVVRAIPAQVAITAGQAVNLMGWANAAPVSPSESMTLVPVRIS